MIGAASGRAAAAAVDSSKDELRPRLDAQVGVERPVEVAEVACELDIGLVESEESASARACSDGECKVVETALAEAGAVLGVVAGDVTARARPLTMAAQDIGKRRRERRWIYREQEFLQNEFCKAKLVGGGGGWANK